MVAPVITEEEVHAACVQLEQDGRQPSVRSVYDALGRRGGMTTITRHVRSWRERQAAPEVPDLVLTPEEEHAILAFGRQMLDVLTRKMRSEMDEIEARAAARVRAAEVELSEMAEAAEMVQAERDDAHSRADAAEVLAKENDELLSRARELIAVLTSERDTARDRAEKSDKDNADLLARIEAAEAAKAQAEGRAAEIARERDEAEARARQADALSAQHVTEIARLTEAVVGRDQRIEDMQSQARTARTDWENMRQELEKARKDRDTERNRRAEAEALLTRTRG